MTARTIPTLPTWTAGMRVTGANLATMTAYQSFWADPPMFRMYQVVAQSVTSGSDTQIIMDTSAYDSDAGRAAGSPYSYTIPTGMTGRWRFTVCTMWAANATGLRAAQVRVNGSVPASQAYAAFPPVSGNITGAIVTVTVPVNSGDAIAAYGYQSSGGALNTQTGGLGSFFEGCLVSLATP